MIVLGGVLLFISLLFTGCLGIPYERPDISIPDQYQHAEESVSISKIKDRWWEDFHNEEINKLVKMTIKYNHDIKISTERILQAEASLGRAKSALFPSVDLNLNLSRKKEGTILNTVNASLMASYEIDIWGRLRSTQRAERYALLEAEENRNTIIQSIIAEVVSLYFQKEGIERKIEITKKRIENARDTLQMVESRYRMGLVSYLDLIEAEGNLSEAEALLPPLYQSLYDTQQKLAILTGQYPKTYPEDSLKRNYFNLLEPVPTGLPSELLLRRPDIRAAEARINRMYEMLKSARARRFPSITLTGSYGWASTSLSNLFRPENELWQIASGILEPIFDAGRLKKEEQEALSRYREALISYSKTVLNAFYEVENALLNRKLLLEKRNQLLKVLKNAKVEEKTSTEQYIRGLTDLLSVLRAKDRRFTAEESLIDVETSILLNRVSLYRALGGGWRSHEKKGVE